MRAISVFALAAGLLSVSMPLLAHHGTAVFDTNKTVTLKGSVTEWDWSNPHCLLQFDVKNESGQVGALDRRDSKSRKHGLRRLWEGIFQTWG